MPSPRIIGAATWEVEAIVWEPQCRDPDPGTDLLVHSGRSPVPGVAMGAFFKVHLSPRSSVDSSVPSPALLVAHPGEGPE